MGQIITLLRFDLPALHIDTNDISNITIQENGLYKVTLKTGNHLLGYHIK